MKKLLFLPVILACCIFYQTEAAQTPIESKFQSWNEVQLILPLARKKDAKGKFIDTVAATFSGVLRIGRKNWDFLDNRYGLALDFRVNKFLNLTTAALYRKDELIVNRRSYETRLHVGFTLSKTWQKITFRDRSMYERRLRNSRRDTHFYRHRFQIGYPIMFKEKELFTPFVINESYWDLRTHKWTENEFFAGITRKFTPKISLDLGYIRKDSLPTNINGVFTNLRIRLR